MNKTNHSNDATIVKNFHLWGRESNVATSTVHDAFFTNTTDMLRARNALRKIYANTTTKNSIKDTLDEMLKRGLPKDIYKAFLNEAIDIGLIPVAGRSVIGGKLITENDILKFEDIMVKTLDDYSTNHGWYGVN